MDHVLNLYSQIYPYLPMDHLGKDLFKQQCYCVTHLILALSNYGRYRLPSRLFRAEWKFLHTELRTVLRMEDPELVGEFVDCLSILCAPEQSLDLIRGRSFLLDLEARFGTRGRWTDTDADFYRHYHSSWCAAVGLMDHAFQVLTHSASHSQ
jgi:hypothetical protein